MNESQPQDKKTWMRNTYQELRRLFVFEEEDHNRLIESAQQDPVLAEKKNQLIKLKERIERSKQTRMRRAVREREFNELRAIQSHQQVTFSNDALTTQPQTTSMSVPMGLEPEGLIGRINEIEAELMSEPIPLVSSASIQSMDQAQVMAQQEGASVYAAGDAVSRFQNPGVFDFAIDNLSALGQVNELAIEFAQGAYDKVSTGFTSLLSERGTCIHEKDAWLTALDVYRVLGRWDDFQNMALAYANQFEEPCVLQRISKDSALQANVKVKLIQKPDCLTWIAPSELTPAALDALQEMLKQVDQYEVALNWDAVQMMSDEQCAFLSALLLSILPREGVVYHANISHLIQIVKQHGESIQDSSQAWWKLHLLLLQWLDKPDLYEKLSLQYCLRFEEAPSVWRIAKCLSYVVVDVDHLASLTQKQWEVVLEGEITRADMGLLSTLQEIAGNSSVCSVRIDCKRLMRLDFEAGAYILNWAKAYASLGGCIYWQHAHRLLAQLLYMLGILEYGKVSFLR